MFKILMTLGLSIFTLTPSFNFASTTACGCFGDCCTSAEIGIGWRRDSLDWDVDHLHQHSYSCYFDGSASSHIEFDDIDMYTAYAKIKWIGEAYTIRLSAQYGTTEKGRAEENFKFHSDLIGETVRVHTDDPIKRRSEVYDFNGAVGYPFILYHQRLNITPLIGFSFHRQHLRVKQDEYSSHSFVVDSYNPFSFYDYSSYYSSSNYFSGSYSSDSSDLNPYFIYNPFSDCSDPTIASALGLSAFHHTNTYRFTWYGFYLGVDLAYALDPCWTIFTELEWHFYDNCHRKRKSNTGVYFVDRYHHKHWAQGFNGSVGAVWLLGTCWYATATVDFKYWSSHDHRDNLRWKSVGTNLALGYIF